MGLLGMVGLGLGVVRMMGVMVVVMLVSMSGIFFIIVFGSCWLG